MKEIKKVFISLIEKLSILNFKNISKLKQVAENTEKLRSRICFIHGVNTSTYVYLFLKLMQGRGSIKW